MLNEKCNSATEHQHIVPRYVSIVFVLALLFATPQSRADYSTTIDPTATSGQWEGWGTSLCWWAAAFGDRDDIANVLFTTNTTVLNGASLPGLGLNIARYNVGACTTNSTGTDSMAVSPNMNRNRQMPGYWLNWYDSNPSSTSWNWAVDLKQRTMLQKARARGANLLELFSNSPLWWMCYNHNPSGADNGGDNLQSWNYQSHAVYLASVANYFRTNWGITFTSVEPFNEPGANWWTSQGTQEGCHFDASTQTSVIGYLRSELDARGMASTIVAASDENSYDQATSTWSSFSAATQLKVGRINVHGYQYGGGRRDLLFSAAAGKKLWNTEYGKDDTSGVNLADNLNLDFHWLHPTAWCYWQPLDYGGWGLIQADDASLWLGPVNSSYYVLAHYTRHIRPGMTIVDGGEPNTVAAYDPAARKLVIVTINHDTPQLIRYDLSRFFAAAGPISRRITATGNGSKYALTSGDVRLTNKTFQASFSANSIQTFEIQGVMNVPALPPAVSNFFAIAGDSQISLSWRSSLSATNYHVKRGLTTNGPFNLLGNTTAIQFTDNSALNDQTYCYIVAPQNSIGDGPYTSAIASTPRAPVRLAIMPQGDRLFLAWPLWASNASVYWTTNLSDPILWNALTNTIGASNGLWNANIPLSADGCLFLRVAP